MPRCSGSYSAQRYSYSARSHFVDDRDTGPRACTLLMLEARSRGACSACSITSPSVTDHASDKGGTIPEPISSGSRWSECEDVGGGMGPTVGDADKHLVDPEFFADFAGHASQSDRGATGFIVANFDVAPGDPA